MNREIKFRAWHAENKEMVNFNNEKLCADEYQRLHLVMLMAGKYGDVLMQYTGLKDKDGLGLTELYEGDILSENGVIVGSVYEVQPRETDLVIPSIRSKDWLSAYQEAVARGFDYAK